MSSSTPNTNPISSKMAPALTLQFLQQHNTSIPVTYQKSTQNSYIYIHIHNHHYPHHKPILQAEHTKLHTFGNPATVHVTNIQTFNSVQHVQLTPHLISHLHSLPKAREYIIGYVHISVSYLPTYHTYFLHCKFISILTLRKKSPQGTYMHTRTHALQMSTHAQIHAHTHTHTRTHTHTHTHTHTYERSQELKGCRPSRYSRCSYTGFAVRSGNI